MKKLLWWLGITRLDEFEVVAEVDKERGLIDIVMHEIEGIPYVGDWEQGQLTKADFEKENGRS
jgi:hypothetical protein